MKKLFQSLGRMWILGIALPVWVWLVTLIACSPLKLIDWIFPSAFGGSNLGLVGICFILTAFIRCPAIMGWLLSKTVVTPRSFFGTWIDGETELAEQDAGGVSWPATPSPGTPQQ